MIENTIRCYDDDIKNINIKLQIASANDIGYIFVSDLHNGAYLLTDDEGHLSFYESDELTNFKEQERLALLDAIARIAKSNDSIDFICVGGDIINGYETCDGAREKAAKLITRQLDVLKKSGKRILVLMGNHDDGSFHRIYYPWWGQVHTDIVFSDKYWKDHFLTPYIPEDCVHDSKYAFSKYYYYDLEKNGKLTRIICLDNFDARMPFDELGSVTEWIRENAEYGYSANQLKWLVSEALTPGFNGEVIVLSHMGIDKDANGHNTPRGEKLRAILSAFQTKTAFCDDELGVNIDYSKNTGKILNYHFGHIHKNTLTYGEDIDLWQISTDAACFDAMLVSCDGIRRLHVGSGEDAQIKFYKK